MPETEIRDRAIGSPSAGRTTRRAIHAAEPSDDVVIFQNCYADGQERFVDPAFAPHDGRANANTHYREVGLFMRLFHSDIYKSGRYTGIVSPKFGQKTRVAGSEFVRFIRSNPGYDVYFINPYPGNAYYSFNVWDHGEICHEGLIAVAQDLFDRGRIPIDLSGLGRNTHSTLLYCNYWAGNARFWRRFMELNIRLIDVIENLPTLTRERLFALDPHYPDPVPLLPFIFERLFSTLLLCDRSINGLAYPHTRAAILRSCDGNLDEPLIISSFIDVIDEIDQRGEYDSRDLVVFEAIGRLKRRLNSGPVRLRRD
jgi:hypothetical protein